MSEEQNNPEGEQGTEEKQYTKAEVDAMIAEATTGLKENRDKVLQEKKSTQQRIQELEQEKKALERKQVEAEGDPEKIKESIRNEYQEKLDAIQQERDTIEQRYRQRVFDAQLRDAAAQLPIAPEGLDALATYIEKHFAVDFESDQATIEGQPPDKFLERFIETDKGKFWRRGKQNTGGGAETPNQRPEGGGKKLSEMTPEQKAHLFTHDKPRYWQLREAEKQA